MPKIFCCLCSHRIETSKPKFRVGTNTNWELLGIHIEKNGLQLNDFSKDDFVCGKCHAKLAHHSMKDRGPNKVANVVPITYEQGIKKTSLRSYKNSLENNEAEEQTAKPSEIDVAVPPQTSTNSVTNSQPLQKCLTDINDMIAADQEVISAGSDVNQLTSGQVENRVPTNQQNFVSVGASDTSDVRDSHSVPVRGELSSCQRQSKTSSAASNGTTARDDAHLTEVADISLICQKTVISSADESLTETVSLGVSTTTEQNMVTSIPVTVNTIHLQGIKTTQSRCFICSSTNGRKAIPWSAIRQTWFQLRCYVPKTNRTCDDHLTHSHSFNDAALQTIKTLMQDIDVEIKEFEPWLHGVSDISKSTPYNFDEDGIKPDKYRMFLGIEKDSFDDLLQYLKGMRNTSTRSLRNALAMFLLLLRNNMKQEIIAFNFSTTQQAVSKTIDAVSLALEENFVPDHLGYYHITREEALEKHSIKLTSKVLGQSETKLCVIADGTYNYIEKPSDFNLQRKTFSMHKRRNLLKPLYIVFPDGYILEAAGPYFCDSKNNDAANIRHHYENSDLLLFLDEEDYFLLDRGYRDVVDETVERGFSVFMPSLLTGKRTNFDCDEANSSRMVTMFRWVVEAVNGRIKNVFPFFKHTIEGTYVPKIMRFNRIACAIMNKYFPPLVDNKEFHDVISEVCAGEIPKTNDLKYEIEKLGLKRMTTRWEKASASSVVDFPKLTMDDLRRITLGSYQIKIAERYIETHLRENSDFGIFIHRETEGIIRARIQSRFSKCKTHDAWVKFNEGERGYESIKGLYCTCKVGERTLGCCSHLTSVLRYLGFERHQPLKEKARPRFEWDAIDCDDSCGDESENDV